MTVALSLAAPSGALAAWEPAGPISNDAAGFGNVGASSSVAVGANGLATALFFQSQAGSNQFTNAYFTRRESDSASWTTPQGSPLASSSAPTTELAGNSEGDALGIWSGSNTQAAAWPAGELVPGPVATVANSAPGTVAIDDQGNGYAVVRSQPPGNVLFARFDATARTWSAAKPIAQGENPQIAVNGQGDIAVAYRRFVETESRIFVRRKLAGAAAFSDEVPFDPQNAAAVLSSPVHAVAIDDAGAITLVFTDDPDGKPFLERAFARRWLPDEDSPEDTELLSSPRPAYQSAMDPKVVVDQQGRVTAAWQESNSGGAVQWVYSAERTGDRGFGFPERVSPASQHFTDDESSKPPDGVSPENERTVSAYDLAVDAEGTATIVYSDAPEGSFNAADVDVKAARRATGGRWTAPVSVRSTAAGAGDVVNSSSSVAAEKTRQADATFVQSIDGQRKLMATRFEGPPPPAGEHQTMVTSEDGTQIFATWCPAPTGKLDPEGRAPTVIAGSGWGDQGRRCPPGNEPEETYEGVFGNTSIQALHDAGYNVLTFDARGFWRSGGTAMIDSPDFEGTDAKALIDYVAKMPEALTDAPGDPRLGMAGGSYAGGMQFLAAGLDQRVDAIAPSIAWNSLATSLFKRNSVKAGWAAILAGAGVPTTALPGVLSPAGIETGHMAPEVYDAVAQGASSGMISPGLRSWFAERGPDHLLDRVRAPTLLLQGTPDTLFTLEEAHQNYSALQKAGTEVKMLWFCGGHGRCFTEAGEQAHIDNRVISWFDRHLRGRRSVSTGPEFEWIDERGRWNAHSRYPLPEARRVRGRGKGKLRLEPGEYPDGGIAVYASPSPRGVEVPIERPARGATVLGAPHLRLRYRATGTSTIGAGTAEGTRPRTFVYAQIVDETQGIVVNNLATPIPIALDGKEHTLSIGLERIASRARSKGYSLQIIPQTSVYDGQRAAGEVDMRSIDVSLPVAGQARKPPRLSEDLPFPGPPPAPSKGGRRIVGTPGNDRLIGTPGDDVIICGAGDDRVIGLGGDDFIDCGAGNDTINSGAGNDRVLGGSGNDFIRGAAGADRIRGQSGNDRLGGGEGRDRIEGGSGNDRIAGNEGRDRIGGNSGNDRISGNESNDRIFGGSGRDRISGNSGFDRIRGNSGRDRIAGNSGNDRLAGGSGRDRIAGNSGRDRLWGNSAGDRLSGGSGNDRLSGGSGNDRLFGDSGNDRLFGGSGRDRLFGGTGRDRLFGGSGRDRLSGGRGRDRLRGGPGRDRLRGGPGRDRVRQR